jgi:hypothetical protein
MDLRYGASDRKIYKAHAHSKRIVNFPDRGYACRRFLQLTAAQQKDSEQAR